MRRRKKAALGVGRDAIACCESRRTVAAPSYAETRAATTARSVHRRDDRSLHKHLKLRDMDDPISLLQWPAMAVTLGASWLVASSDAKRRNWGFWVFLASNALWVVWGWSTQSWALVILQFALAAMNIRGAFKTDKATDSEEACNSKGGDTAAIK